MTDTDKLILRANAHELFDTIGSLYSNEFADGMMKLPKELHKHQDTIARAYNLADMLKTNLDEQL
jgi:hypothetical protein